MKGKHRYHAPCFSLYSYFVVQDNDLWLYKKKPNFSKHSSISVATIEDFKDNYCYLTRHTVLQTGRTLLAGSVCLLKNANKKSAGFL